MTKYLQSLFFVSVLFVSCRSPFVVTKNSSSQYKFTDTSFTDIDSSLEKEIDPYREKMNVTMNQVLAYSTHSLEKGLPESRLGNFLADACMFSANVKGTSPDFAVFNNGGLRRPLPQGQITRGDVFELMPFENELVILTVNGNDVKKIYNFIASKGGAPVSGLQMHFRDSMVTNVLINNSPFDSTKTYRVLTSDYLANGGDSFNFFIGLPRQSVSLKVRDALIFYLEEQTKKNKQISTEIDGRMIHDK